MKKRYISKDKIKFNIKKYWLIFVVMLIIAVFVGMFKSVDNADKEKINESIESTSESEKYYRADVRAYLDSDIDTSNYKNLSSSATLKKELNEALKNKGYAKIASTDIISVGFENNSQLWVGIIGAKDESRVEFMADTMIKLAMKLVDEQLGIHMDCSYDDVELIRVEKDAKGNFVEADDEELSIEEKTSAADQTEEISSTDNSRFSIKNLFSAKGAVIILSGLVIGAFIIYILIILDSHIYVPEDVSALYDGELAYMGNLNSKTIATTNAVIMARASKEGLNKLAITESQDYLDEKNRDCNCINEICKLNDKIVYLENLDTNVESIGKLNDYDGVIVCIHSVYDSEKSINIVKDKIGVVGANLIGYVMD